MADESASDGGKQSRKGLVTVLVAVVGLALAAAGGAAFLVLTDGKTGEAKADKKPASLSADQVYYQPVPQMIVGLDGPGHDRVQLHVSLEVASQAAKSEVKRMSPRIMDAFRQHLSDLTPGEMDGEAGTKKLRQALLKRARAATQEAEVHGLLFRKLVVH
ncbi:Flagellar basal body-associated protein FliL [Limimonas halophila]|uniref:Flagellar protein FliL n=1 Tax=Limimonas halophila TaxID=1082479 RepID=A0A1G7T6F8_9PROT|nr:flagellar basal body-associated FliL family protein [Limimonas halophila]SDG30865.1 Flagellar basal body-associated protein FliL [Limimonas halophila]